MRETEQEANPIVQVTERNAPRSDLAVCNETTCMFDGKEYGEGSEVCMGGYIHVCRNGQWVTTNRPC